MSGLSDITPEGAECKEIVTRINGILMDFYGTAIYRAKPEHVRWIRASLANAFAHMEQAGVFLKGGPQADEDAARLEGNTVRPREVKP